MHSVLRARLSRRGEARYLLVLKDLRLFKSTLLKVVPIPISSSCNLLTQLTANIVTISHTSYMRVAAGLDRAPRALFGPTLIPLYGNKYMYSMLWFGSALPSADRLLAATDFSLQVQNTNRSYLASMDLLQFCRKMPRTANTCLTSSVYLRLPIAVTDSQISRLVQYQGS